MAFTNFGKLTDHQSTVWARDVWREARETSFFIRNFAGSDANSMIHSIKELREVKGAARAVITLVPDLEGDGVVGDNQLEGNEEEIKAYDQVFEYDQIRNANRLEGRMADMRSIIAFRSNSRNLLAHWLATRLDELFVLTASGVSFDRKTNGAMRIGSQFPQLAFAPYVTAPSANRHFRWDSATGLEPAGTNLIDATDLPTWDMIMQLKAYAEEHYIRPVSTDDGVEVYTLFLHPAQMAALKQDTKFQEMYKLAASRGSTNLMFKGTSMGGKASGIFIDGINIVSYRNVFNTRGAPSGSKWGAGGTVNGARALLVGAQALAMADIGVARWVEKDFDYDNSPGVSIAKLIGFKKPQWRSAYTGTVEDFSVVALDTAI